MKKLLIAAAVAVASLGAAARSSSDDWADKNFSKDEQARMERAMKTVELSGECGHYRALMDTPLAEKNRDGDQIVGAVILLARDVYGKMFDAMAKDSTIPNNFKAQSREFMIGMFYGTAMEKGSAEGLKRSIAEPTISGKGGMDLMARRLYRERNCDLLPRSK